MKELILLVLGFVLVNNYALTAYFGLTPLLGFASRREKILVLGLSVTGVMLVTSVILWLLRGLIPAWAQILCGVPALPVRHQRRNRHLLRHSEISLTVWNHPVHPRHRQSTHHHRDRRRHLI